MKENLLFILFSLFLPSIISAENEPNDLCSQANPMSLDVLQTGNFGQAWDNDFYTIKITQGGVYSIQFSHPDNVLKASLSIYRGDNCEDGIIYANIRDQISVLICESGTYKIRLFSETDIIFNEKYTLLISAILHDEYECNNSFEKAALVSLNTSYTAYLEGRDPWQIIWQNDIDFYKMNIPIKGRLSLNFPLAPPNKTIDVRLYDIAKQFIGREVICDTSNQFEYIQCMVCDTGTYYFSVNYWNNFIKSGPDKYSFEVAFIPDSTDCNETPANAFHIEQNRIYNCMFGGKNSLTKDFDTDWFSFNINEPQVFKPLIENVNKDAVIVKVIGPKNDVIINSTYYPDAGFINDSDYQLCEAGEYFIQLTSIPNNKCMGHSFYNPYIFQITNLKSDPYECNNTIETAYNANIKNLYEADFNCFYDNDIYKLQVRRFDTLFIKLDLLPNSILYKIKISNSSGQVLRNTSQVGPIEFKQVNIFSPDTLFVELTTTNYNTMSLPYTLWLDILKFKTNTTDSDKHSVSLSKNIVTDFLLLNNVNLKNNASFIIYNITGNRIGNFVIQENEKIDVSILPAGIYYLIIENAGTNSVMPFIKL